MKGKKFLRKSWRNHSKLGYGRKKLQKWRKAKGRHNKIREQNKGHPSRPKTGFRKDRSQVNLIQGKFPVIINNVAELEKMQNNEIAIIAGKVGNKNRLEIAKKAIEKKIKILNLNAEKFVRKFEKQNAKTTEKVKHETK